MDALLRAFMNVMRRVPVHYLRWPNRSSWLGSDCSSWQTARGGDTEEVIMGGKAVTGRGRGAIDRQVIQVTGEARGAHQTVKAVAPGARRAASAAYSILRERSLPPESQGPNIRCVLVVKSLSMQ